jgi:hypothetical protein
MSSLTAQQEQLKARFGNRNHLPETAIYRQLDTSCLSLSDSAIIREPRTMGSEKSDCRY